MCRPSTSRRSGARRHPGLRRGSASPPGSADTRCRRPRARSAPRADRRARPDASAAPRACARPGSRAPSAAWHARAGRHRRAGWPARSRGSSRAATRRSVPGPTAPWTPRRSSPSARRRAAHKRRRPAFGPSRPRSSGRPSPGLGLRCEEGRGSSEQITLLTQPRVLSAQPPQLLALRARQAVIALARIEPGPLDPVPAATAARPRAPPRHPGPSGPNGPSGPPRDGTPPGMQASFSASNTILSRLANASPEVPIKPGEVQWRVVACVAAGGSHADLVALLGQIAHEEMEMGDQPSDEFARLARRWISTSIALQERD